ncbi:hypothetical protein QBC40DRAFT_120 [Triangularia verruculosa]|uniref:Chromo domain-containing protein n=1 Tax=Triangularia verruculosa TaxID=2587418 RepID=A0AAN6XS78_9PEZI|nr:hypothetical protein QBC40DRAFT_120 [Triangularia verruculosa]
MFKNINVGSVEKRHSSRSDLDDPAESDDDTISLTSTVAPDDDQEYVVETILAELPNQDGTLFYLVQWDASQFDIFLDSTWEPAENLNDELRAQWVDTKAREEAGEVEPFDVNKYFKKQKAKEREQKKRHRRRNAKRARLGLPLTGPLPSPSSSRSSKSLDVDSSEEASEDDNVVEVAAVSRPRSRTSTSSFQKKGVARPKSPTKVSKSATVARASKDGRQSSLSKPAKPAALSDPQPSTKKRSATAASTTGYTGTARKPSRDSTGGLPKSNPASTIRVASGPGSGSGQKPMTARKSTQKTTQSKTGNIFTSGKVRKQRPTMEDVMSDPHKDPKPFSNMHIGRVAQLRSRAREDLAPDPSQVSLFPVTKGPSAAAPATSVRRISNDEDDSLFVPGYAKELHSEPQELRADGVPANQTGLAPVLTGLPTTSTGLTPTSAGISPGTTVLPSTPVPISRPPLKKRKSVRFPDEVKQVIVFHEPEYEPEHMDVDEVSVETCSQAPLVRPPTPPRMSRPPQREVIPIVQGNTKSQKKMTFGKRQSGSKLVPTTFTGLPDQSSDQWLSSFLATDMLEFDYTCLATAVATSFNSLVKTALAFGGVSSDTDKSTVEKVASYLRAGMLGLLCARPEYHILIFPTKCEEWNEIKLLGLPTSSNAATSTELQYYIFVPHVDFLGMLPQPDSVPPRPAGVEKELPNRQAILRKFFDFDYKRLLPSKPGSTHHFFLAFPDTKLEVRLLVFHWLRASNPNCCIFTNEQAGSWRAFQEKLKLEKTSGVVIVHELLAGILSGVPNLGYHLFHQDDRWWCLTEPISALPMFPSTNSLREENPVAPGHLQLTRLFPQGTAILLTPSFLVSEPTRALEIIDWFLANFSKSTTYRLVTAWDIATYLKSLADEKDHDRRRLLASPTATESTASLAIEENLQGLSREDCENRYLAATKAFELDDLRMRRVPPLGDNEESATLVYAIDSIDPNDEQSLVNWFGYWSTLRLDMFRHFYVLGTDDTMTARRCGRGEREIAVPKYADLTINDPDSVMRATLDLYQSRKMEAQQPAGAAAPDGAQMATVAPTATDIFQATTIHDVQSDLFSRVDAGSLVDMLRDLGPKDWNSSLWVLYGFPISWLDAEMADHFQDFKQGWHTISTWFRWGYSWGGKTGMTRYNTYVGFFYTIADEWDPSNKPTDRRAKRHPWLVFYRPCNAHKRPSPQEKSRRQTYYEQEPWAQAELIIWDPAAPRKFGNRQPHERELTFMQREVIKHVREHGPAKNAGSKLTDVWLGGYKIPDKCHSPYDVDVVTNFIQAICNEKNFKEFIPAPYVVMKRPDSGFKRVNLIAEVNEGPRLTNYTIINGDADDVPMDTEESELSSDEEDTRIIFHAPRPLGRPLSGGPTKCQNRLHEEARLWRIKHGKRSHMRYQFVPTTEWYKEQQEEGRGFSHITVGSWQTIFNALKIGQGASLRGHHRESGAGSA